MLYDPAQRALEKQRRREEDESLVASGEKTQEQLRQENGLFAFPKVRVCLDEAESLS